MLGVMIMKLQFLIRIILLSIKTPQAQASNMKSKRICIIGAGLSGLSLAWKKENLGHKVQIIESASRVGGVLQSKYIEGYLLDYGANSLSLRFQDTYDTLFQMGVMDHAIDADSITNKRFIVRSGKLVALPLNLPSFFLSSFFGLIVILV